MPKFTSAKLEKIFCPSILFICLRADSLDPNELVMSHQIMFYAVCKFNFFFAHACYSLKLSVYSLMIALFPAKCYDIIIAVFIELSNINSIFNLK